MTDQLDAAGEGMAPGGEPAGSSPMDVVDEDLLGSVAFDQRGLVTVVVQDAVGRDVLMVAHMDREALMRTVGSGRSWFWSRSRSEYWCKGETSGDRQWVRAVRYDCDGDALLVLVDQDGNGACHTGARSCFYRSFGAGDANGAAGGPPAQA